jgi:hypothetical protein
LPNICQSDYAHGYREWSNCTVKYAIRILIVLLVSLLTILPTIQPARAQSSAAWTEIRSSGAAPEARYDHMMIIADDLGKLLVFGGKGGAGDLNDTWVFDVKTSAWKQISAGASVPSPRHGGSLNYDPTRKRAVLFGGLGPSGNLNDTWTFDLEKEAWSQVTTKGTTPAIRYGHSTVYDPKRDQLLVSHGFSNTRFDDTFALDLKTDTWVDISPAARPLKRCLHDAIFDTKYEQMYLYGGCSSGFGPCPQGDLWLFDPAKKGWTEIKPSGAAPAGRDNPSLIYHPLGSIWLFGGRTGNGVANDLWTFVPADGAWKQITAPNAPAARRSHRAVWDAVNSRMLVFGGRGDSGALADMWAFVP